MQTLLDVVRTLEPAVKRKINLGRASDSVVFDIDQLSDFEYDPRLPHKQLQDDLEAAFRGPLLQVFDLKDFDRFRFEIRLLPDAPSAELTVIYTGK